MSDPTTDETDAPPVPEPSRVVERVAALLLLLFAVLTFLVRDHWGPVVRVDESTGFRVARWTSEHRFLEDVATVTSLLGSLPVRFLVIAALAAFLAVRGHRRGAWFVLVVALGGTLLNVVVKTLVDRPRPTVPEPLTTAQGMSFPSGHAMAAAICYSLVASALLFSGVVDLAPRRTLVVVAVAIPLAVGAARVLLGVHYASDVVGGWALGLAGVALATSVVRPWRRAPSSGRGEGPRRATLRRHPDGSALAFRPSSAMDRATGVNDAQGQDVVGDRRSERHRPRT